jgi:hypothetical protein
VTDVRAAPSETDESLSSSTLGDRSVLCVDMSATAWRASGVGALSRNPRDVCTSDVDPADSRFATIIDVRGAPAPVRTLWITTLESRPERSFATVACDRMSSPSYSSCSPGVAGSFAASAIAFADFAVGTLALRASNAGTSESRRRTITDVLAAPAPDGTVSSKTPEARA